jgi:hypothetical protein
MKRATTSVEAAVPVKKAHSEPGDGWTVSSIRDSLPSADNTRRRAAKVYRLIPGSDEEYRPTFDVNATLSLLASRIRRYVLAFSQAYSKPAVSVKYYIALTIGLKKDYVVDGENETKHITPTFRGSISIYYPSDTETYTAQCIDSQAAEIESALSNFTEEGSSWTVERVLHLDINIAVFEPLFERAGQPTTYIALPEKIKYRRAVINVLNTDLKCFLWSVLVHLLPGHKSHYKVNQLREYHLRNPNCVNESSLKYPVSIRNIDAFEFDNPHISINVFAYIADDDEIIPYRISRHRGRSNIINLLIYSDGQNSHYAYINTKLNFNGMSRLFRKQTGNNRGCSYCFYCLRRFYCENAGRAEELCFEHMQTCTDVGTQVIRYPSLDSEKQLKFADHAKTLRCPFVIFCDVECMLYRLSGPNPQASANSSMYVEEALHVPYSYAFLVVNSEGSIYEPITLYSAPDESTDVIAHMLEALATTCKRLSNKIKSTRIKVLWKTAQKRQHEQQTVCWICKEPFVSHVHNLRKVIHHDHFNGEYIGAVHDRCNRACRKSDEVTIVLHNFGGYDSHFILQSLHKVFPSRVFDVMAENSEKIISLSIKDRELKMRFIDSFRFLPASLDSLVNDLKNDPEGEVNQKFKITQQAFGESFEYFLRKGIFCFDYMDAFHKLSETELPPKDCFFSKLLNRPISEHDYEYAKQLWDRFNIANLGQYFNLYLKSDICLLADVFQRFRAVLYNNFGLEALHYVSLPSYAWASMLKVTGVNIELLCDSEYYQAFEAMKRGGMVNVPHRYAKAQNKYTRAEDAGQLNVGAAEDDDTFIAYYDVNSSYASSLSEPLPLSDFRWLSAEEIESIDLLKVSDDSETGYLVVCDLTYPEALHDQHNDLPLAPHRVKITKNMLSPFLKDNASFHHVPSEKLMNTLYPKENYTLHYRTYKFYVAHGLIVKKIHKVMSFKQAPYIRPFIELNTRLRNDANSKFQKDIWKRTVNSTYGRSIMNKLKRVSFKLATTPASLKKLIASNFLKSWHIINQNTVSIVSKQHTVFLNTPIFIGATVLELSKLLLFRFHYEYIKRTYCSTNADGCRLLYLDTDSLVYLIKTQDLFEDVNQAADRIDRSNFSNRSKCYDPTPTRIGLMKLETADNIVREFVGLKPKMYSITGYNINMRKAKGVSRRIVVETDHEAYHTVLKNNVITYADFLRFQSKAHNVKTVKQRKKFLSPTDDKRFILQDGISTLAYGHVKAILIQTEHHNNNPHPVFQTLPKVTFSQQISQYNSDIHVRAENAEIVVVSSDEGASEADSWQATPDIARLCSTPGDSVWDNTSSLCSANSPIHLRQPDDSHNKKKKEKIASYQASIVGNIPSTSNQAPSKKKMATYQADSIPSTSRQTQSKEKIASYQASLFGNIPSTSNQAPSKKKMTTYQADSIPSTSRQTQSKEKIAPYQASIFGNIPSTSNQPPNKKKMATYKAASTPSTSHQSDDFHSNKQKSPERHFDSEDDAYIYNACYSDGSTSPDLIEASQPVSPSAFLISDANKFIQETNNENLSLDIFDEMLFPTPTDDQFNSEEDVYILNAEQPPSADKKQEDDKIPPSLLMDSIADIAPQDISLESPQFQSLFDFLNK